VTGRLSVTAAQCLLLLLLLPWLLVLAKVTLLLYLLTETLLTLCLSHEWLHSCPAPKKTAADVKETTKFAS
jgi:hypothetical protein